MVMVAGIIVVVVLVLIIYGFKRKDEHAYDLIWCHLICRHLICRHLIVYILTVDIGINGRKMRIGGSTWCRG